MKGLIFGVLAATLVFAVSACDGKEEAEVVLETIEAASPAEPELPPVRPEKLERFRELLEVYNAAIGDDEEKSYSSLSRKDMERAHLITFYLHRQVQCAYRHLNEAEVRAFFADTTFTRELPGGMYLGVGGPTTSIAGIPLGEGNSREDFEDFLRYSFMETDYMSAFETSEEESQVFFAIVAAALDERGLACEW